MIVNRAAGPAWIDCTAAPRSGQEWLYAAVTFVWPYRRSTGWLPRPWRLVTDGGRSAAVAGRGDAGARWP